MEWLGFRVAVLQVHFRWGRDLRNKKGELENPQVMFARLFNIQTMKAHVRINVVNHFWEIFELLFYIKFA
jgi:hypothetical protein